MGAHVDCFPIPRGLPRYSGESASATSLSRPAQASLALRPTGSLNRPRRPLSQGFDPTGRPVKPLASYQINRQLSGWNLPPLVTRAFGAHGEQNFRLFGPDETASNRLDEVYAVSGSTVAPGSLKATSAISVIIRHVASVEIALDGQRGVVKVRSNPVETAVTGGHIIRL